MKKQTLQTIIFVIIAFLLGFFTKDILHAVMNTKDTIFPSSCTYGNLVYKSGEGFRDADGCNSCSCQDGEVMCTTIHCEQ